MHQAAIDCQVMCKKRRFRIDFREMRSEFTQASTVNKWHLQCKDGRAHNYHYRISLNRHGRKIGCVGYNNGKILFAPLFWILYFPMDWASGKIELSERYIKKLNCGHTLQRHYAVVLYRNNGIGRSSVTAAISCDSAILVYIYIFL